MNNAIHLAQNALKLVLGVGRGTSGRLILEASQEQAVRDALAAIKREAMAAAGFTPGRPPETTEAAWLLIRYEHEEGDVNSVVLAVRDDDEWSVAADWKAESTLNSVYEDGGYIVGWMPYAVPDPVLVEAAATH